jgi:hypothetical protein
MVVVVGGALLLGACSSSSPSSAGTTTATVAAAATTTTAPATTATTAAESTTTTGGAATTTTTAPMTGAQDLVITAEQRGELVAAGAADHGLTDNDFTGLAPGKTYFAIDHATGTYWAGAALVASPSSTQAQVSTQDDGAYLVFEKPAGGTWKVYDVGATVEPGGKCPVTIPATVMAVWGWKAGTCTPPSF